MYGYEIEPPPESLDGKGVLCRVLDGLAFRYYWATEGLRAEDFDFRPGPDSMSTVEILKHVLYLSLMIQQTLHNAPERERFRSDDPEVLRERTLQTLEGARRHLQKLSDGELRAHRVVKRGGAHAPVWNIMNGPIADALTHVGQLNAWRRLSGNPTPPVDVFSGVPPA